MRSTLTFRCLSLINATREESASLIPHAALCEMFNRYAIGVRESCLALGDGIGDVMAAIADDVVQAFADHLRDFFDRFQAAADGPRVPALEELASGGGSRVMPQIAEVFFENPRAASLQEVDGQRLQLLAA